MPISNFNYNVTYDDWRIEHTTSNTWIYYPEEEEPYEVVVVKMVEMSVVQDAPIEEVLGMCEDYDVCGETDDFNFYIFFKRKEV